MKIIKNESQFTKFHESSRLVQSPGPLGMMKMIKVIRLSCDAQKLSKVRAIGWNLSDSADTLMNIRRYII